jgi:very-short-patch-repair endonuclease
VGRGCFAPPPRGRLGGVRYSQLKSTHACQERHSRPIRRQQIIAGFIVDFYCHKAGLVIELDGGVHQENEQKQHDADRDRVLSEMGLRVIRFKNDDIEKNLQDVLVKIRKSLQTNDNKNFGG